VAEFRENLPSVSKVISEGTGRQHGDLTFILWENTKNTTKVICKEKKRR
jgi:hypothetical protein